MATDCTYLYEEYPEVISAYQLYRICHISKRKAIWLLLHGYIPCEDSGKKTRRYKIRLNDVIDYYMPTNPKSQIYSKNIVFISDDKDFQTDGTIDLITA